MEITNHGIFCARSADNSKISIGNMQIFFSFKTVIAVKLSGDLFIRKNEWGPKTGRHLNAIDPDTDKRLPAEKFKEILSTINLTTTVKRA